MSSPPSERSTKVLRSSGSDLEARKSASIPTKLSHWRLVVDQSCITDAVLSHQYNGSGTEDDPYLVKFLPNDPQNPMLWKQWRKWLITMTMGMATFAVSADSSAYSGAVPQIMEEFHCNFEIVMLGLALFVFGYVIGPLFWAPMSELYGRQILFFGTFGALTAFNGGSAGANSITCLLIMRFLCGMFGASPLSNAVAVIADLFTAKERGQAMGILCVAVFLGPSIGPIVGGFMAETVGWRWVQGFMTIFTGTLWIFGAVACPETYGPVLLQKRAVALTKKTGRKYISLLEKKTGKLTPKIAFAKALSRPWALLILEPIVLLLSIYVSILYGILYLLFGAFPIAFGQSRGWSQGISSLAFVPVAIGFLSGTFYAIFDNKRYAKLSVKLNGVVPPEARLPPVMVGAVVAPIGMFMFAWTNYPSIHWIVPMIGIVPLAFGMIQVFIGAMNYLVDAYTIFAASAVAANTVLRSLFGTGFPLFTVYMYDNLGIHWASSIPAFLTLLCLPCPFLFYIYGERIRLSCKYAAQAHQFMEQLRKAQQQTNEPKQVEKQTVEQIESKDNE